jgi:hypothetical protein
MKIAASTNIAKDIMAIEGSFSRRDAIITALLLATLLIFATAGQRPRTAAPPSQLAVVLPVQSPSGIELGARKAVADLDAAAKGRFTLGVETSPVDLGYPIRWGLQNLEPMTLYSLHSLEPAWQLRNLYLQTSDPSALDLAIEIALDYRTRNPLMFPEHPNAWGEHPAANRAIVYLYLGQLASEIGDPRSAVLWRASLECTAFVSRRSQWVSGHNHGLFIGVAILTVGVAMDRDDLVTLGRSRFLQTWDQIVSEDFLLEHNPSYQMAIVELMSRLALVDANSGHADEWRTRVNALRNRVKFLVSPGGQLPKFGDNMWDERHSLPGSPERGAFWFPRAGYLGWRGPDTGVIVDLAAHSRVHSRNTVSSIAIYDRGDELGAYRTHAAYRWLCSGMEGVPEVGVMPEASEPGMRRVRIDLQYGAAVNIQRTLTVTRGEIELRDRLNLPEYSGCRMAVDRAAVVEGGEVIEGAVAPEAREVVTTLALTGNPLASATKGMDLGHFEQVRVQPFDETWDALRKLGHRIRKPGKPPVAFAAMLAGAFASWMLSRRTALHRGASWIFYAGALVLGTAGLAIALLGAFL